MLGESSGRREATTAVLPRTLVGLLLRVRSDVDVEQRRPVEALLAVLTLEVS